MLKHHFVVDEHLNPFFHDMINTFTFYHFISDILHIKFENSGQLKFKCIIEK